MVFFHFVDFFAILGILEITNFVKIKMSQISQMAKYLITVLVSFNQISYLTIKEYKYTPSFFFSKRR